MKETLSTLAAKTGLSITTISRVLSGKADQYRISAKTQEKVTAAAKENDYHPNLVAQNLRSNKTNTIGLMLPEISNPYFADIASAVISEARVKGYTTIVIDSSENAELEKSGISSLLSRQIGGIIATPCGEDPALFEEINNKLMPVILIDRYFKDSTLPYVTTNNYQGSVMATEHLISRGHTRIACIQGVTSSQPNKRRVSGFLSALDKAGLKENAIVVGNDFSVQNGYLETRLLMTRTNRPTAIFALSNTIMLGAVKAIREMGMSIPEDISIIAFDHNLYMDYLTPPVTSISQSTEEMAKLATRMLFDCIAKGERTRSQIELAPALVPGKSVAAPGE